MMEWISVKDRLPKVESIVLVLGEKSSELNSYENTGLEIGLVCYEGIGYSSCLDTCYYDVWYYGITHWMPLPEPPKP